MKKVFSKIVAGSIIIGSLVGFVGIANATLKVVQTPTYHLYSGESSTATSVRITPYPVDLDGTKLTMSDFGTTPTFTVEPKISNYEEIEQFTGITDNGDNTATLTGLSRDLASKYPYTSTGTGKTHGAGATIVFGNNPQVYGRLAAPENNQSWSGIQQFTVPPIINDTNATSTSQVASRAFVIATAFGSTPVLKSAGGTGKTSFGTGAFLFDSGSGTSLTGTTSPTFGRITATTTTATSTFRGGITFASTTGTVIFAHNINVASKATFQSGVTFNDGTNQTTAASPLFGGSGLDGALTITSGATNIDLQNKQVLVKNYSSISITGTGSLTFTHPNTHGTLIILRSTGNVTLTSSAAPMIDVSGLGGAGGTSNIGFSGSVFVGDYTSSSTPGAAGGSGCSASCTNFGGVAGVFATPATTSAIIDHLQLRQITLAAGSGGGRGGHNGGNGGIGGGALYIEDAGTWNFTTVNGISVAGKNGVSPNDCTGGGGGGAAGSFLAIYKTLTANTGTITISGGTGGSPTTGTAGGAGGTLPTGGLGKGGAGGNSNDGGGGSSCGAGGGGGANYFQTANGVSATGATNTNGGGGGGGAAGNATTTKNYFF